MKANYLRLYSSNIPVSGSDRCAIYSLLVGKVFFIPQSLFDVLIEFDSRPFAEVREMYIEESTVFQEYVDYLLKNNLAFWTDHPENFPKMNLEYSSPEIINSAIVIFNSNINYSPMIEDLDEFNCKGMEIRIDPKINSLESVGHFLKELRSSTLRYINLYFTDNVFDYLPEIKQLIHLNKKLLRVAIFNAPYYARGPLDNCEIVLINNEIQNVEVGNGDHQKHIISIPHFMESYFFNPLYNKKVSISYEGEIKNLLEDEISFGNIKTDKLSTICKGENFQKNWTLKDMVTQHSANRYCLSICYGEETLRN